MWRLTKTMTTPIDEAAVLAAIVRCQNTTWQQDSTRLGSQAALMREYLRRAGGLSETLAGNDRWRWEDFTSLLPLPGIDRRFLPGWTFLDHYDEPEYHGPGLDLVEEKVAALQAHLYETKFYGGNSGERTCGWFIRWASVKALPSVAALGLPDPYEPLIVFYERGGWFRREQGYLDLNGANVTLGTYKNQPPLPSLDPAALDEMDTIEPYAWTKKPKDDQ